MADHPRLAILKAFTTHLEGINGTGAWEHNLVGQVYRGRTVFGEEVADTFLSILESPRPAGADYNDHDALRREQWPLLIQGFTNTDPTHPTDPLYSLLAEVEARLTQIIYEDDQGRPKYPSYYLLPGTDGKPQITSLQIEPPVVRPPGNEPPARACFFLPLRVGLARGVG